MAAGQFFFGWDEQCPERMPGLTHAHDRDCLEVHEPPHSLGQCCECEAVRFIPPAMMSGPEVRARVEALGLTPAEPEDMGLQTEPEPEEEPEEDHMPDTIVEPKYAEGTYPKTWGWGRGHATPRFLDRVVAYVGWRKWLSENGGGENE
jgi:hypothetical protein